MSSTKTVLGAVVLAAAVVRIVGIEPFDFHVDELMHLFIAKGDSVSEVLQRGLVEMHPPLGHLIRFAYINVGIDSLLGHRMVSIAFGLLAVFLAFRLGRRIHGPTFGYVLALLTAFSRVTVVYSVSVRNYAFLLPCVFFVFDQFLVFFQNGSRRSLLGYIVLALVCASLHFAGFILAAAFAVLGAFTLARRKKNAQLALWCGAHLPFLVLLWWFYQLYFAPGTFGAGWRAFFSNAPHIKTLRLEEASLLLRLYSIVAFFFAKNAVFGLLMALVFLAGLFPLARMNSLAFGSVLCVFAVQIVLALADQYPLAGVRYCLHLFPFVAVPIASLIVGVSSKLGPSPPRAVLALGPVAASIGLAFSGFYFQREGEMAVTTAARERVSEILRSEIEPSDLVITNRGTGLYLRYDRNRGTEMYGWDPIGRERVGSTKVFFDGSDYLWEYPTADRFLDFISLLEKKRGFETTEHVWFVALGVSDFSIVSLYRCAMGRGEAQHIFFDRGALVFRIDGSVFKRWIDKKKSEISSCLDSSDVPHGSVLLTPSDR